MLALALIAAGAFMGFVLYGSGGTRAGGGVGHALAVALGLGVGRARVLAPIALVGGGAVLLMRPVLPALRPLRTGSVCLACAVVLALAAGTLGVSEGPGANGSQWSAHFLQARGGAAGEALYTVAHGLVQQVGVEILVLFLFVVGLVLLTGASLATVLRATGSGLLDSTSRLRTRVTEHRPDRALRVVGEAGGPAPSEPLPHPMDQLLPPEPEPGRLVVRATHVEAPSVDGEGVVESLDPWAPEGVEEQAPESSDGGIEEDAAEEGGHGAADDADDEAEETIAGVAATDADNLTPRAACASE